MQSERASKKQQELLSFVDGFIKEHGYGPSYREIMGALGYKSVSTVAVHIEGLITKGYVARRDKSARSLEVITANVEQGTQKTDDIEVLLIARINQVNLQPEDKKLIQRALTVLGYNKAAEVAALRDIGHEHTNA